MKSEKSWIRRSQRVIRMVSELHRMGYQRLRIMPYEYPLAWRLCVASTSVFSTHSGAFIPEWMRRVNRSEVERELMMFDGFWPNYSSTSENEYFDWKDAKSDNARTLAEKFIERFPKVAERGEGRDWPYAGWLAELIGHLEDSEFLPFVTAEKFLTKPYSLTYLPIRRPGEPWDDSGDSEGSERFPLPRLGNSTMTRHRTPGNGA